MYGLMILGDYRVSACSCCDGELAGDGFKSGIREALGPESYALIGAITIESVVCSCANPYSRCRNRSR